MANPNQAAVAAIQAAAAKYHLDPKAMIAVSRVESGLNSSAVGDNGHAFGLFQFNNAGGTITGQAHPERYLDANFNAMEAARHISTIPGAVGATGQKAINLIVNKFERPANAPAEISKASSYYGQLKGSTVARAAAYQNVINGSPTASVTPPNASLSGGGSNSSSGGFDPSQALLGYLLNQSNPAHGTSDPTADLMGTVLNPQAQAANAVQTASKTNPAIVKETSGKVTPEESKVVDLAKSYLGTPYKWGGADPKGGFDCSGFVQFVHKQTGINIPRTTYEQLKAGTPVEKKDLQPGDAVFFHGGEHEGMYIGNGKFIQSPHTGDVVKISDLNSYGGYFGARRFGK